MVGMVPKKMVAQNMLRMYEVKKVISENIDVTKCLRQIEIPD